MADRGTYDRYMKMWLDTGKSPDEARMLADTELGLSRPQAPPPQPFNPGAQPAAGLGPSPSPLGGMPPAQMPPPRFPAGDETRPRFTLPGTGMLTPFGALPVQYPDGAGMPAEDPPVQRDMGLNGHPYPAGTEFSAAAAPPSPTPRPDTPDRAPVISTRQQPGGRGGGTVIGEPGEDGTGKGSAGIFAGVFGDEGGGWGKLRENWSNMDEDKKNRVYEAMIAMGGTMMTTPGNFGEGLGAGVLAGLGNYQDQEQFDTETGMKREELDMKRRAADLSYDLAVAEYEMMKERRNDPNLSQAERDEAEAAALLARARLEAYQRGDYSFGTSQRDLTRLQEYQTLVQQYVAGGVDRAAAEQKAAADVLAAYGKTEDSFAIPDERVPLDQL